MSIPVEERSVIRQTCIVYGLRLAGTEAIRYVGQTTMKLHQRLSDHLKLARAGRIGHKHAWIRKALRDGLLVEIIALETGAEWNTAEAVWISRLKNLGCFLLNQTDGGEARSGYKLSSSQRTAISGATKRLWASEGYRAKVSDGHQRYWTEERRQQQASKARSQPISEVQRAVTSLRMREFYADAANREKQARVLDIARSSAKRVEAMKIARARPEYRKHQSDRMKEVWRLRREAIHAC